MIGPTSCSRYSNDVTMPKLPLPPRSPQKRSGFSSALAVTRSPAAVTTSADSRLSAVRPHLRSSQPLPLPSVSPAIPVVEKRPPVTASPCSCVAASNSPQVKPGLRARRPRVRIDVDLPSSATGRSRSPPSQVRSQARSARRRAPRPSRPPSRAKFTAATTSSGVAQRAISAGWRSWIPFQTSRASS